MTVRRQRVELICAVIVPGRVGMTELGKQLHHEKTNLSNLMDHAEQRGLVVRTRDPKNRRMTWVELTDGSSDLSGVDGVDEVPVGAAGVEQDA